MEQTKEHIDDLGTLPIGSGDAPAALPPRVPGRLKGKIWIAPDFDAPDPEIEALFYGSDS